MKLKATKNLEKLNVNPKQVINPEDCSKVKGGGGYYCCIRQRWIGSGGDNGNNGG